MSTTTTPQNGQAGPEASKPLRVGDLLVERGLVTLEQVEQAITHQRDRGHRKLLGEVMVELRFVTEEQVLEAVAQAYQLPFARLHAKVADPAVLEVLPRDFLEKHSVLPLFLVENKLTLALHEPSNVFLVEEVERLSGYAVQVVVATAKDIRQTLQAHLPSANVFVIDDLVGDMQEEDLSVLDTTEIDLADLENAAGDSPVIKLVNYLIHSAVQDLASDIHIEPGDKALRVRYRIDGKLFEKIRPPYQMAPAVVSRIKIMAGMDISERRAPQDGGITVMINKRPVDLRVSSIPGKFGEKVVMRVIDHRAGMASLEQLGFRPNLLERLRTLVHLPNGVVLVTGPTGSGKSTTLYAALNEINDEHVNICTVEDPVEYHLTGVNQFQVNDKANFTFARALRSLLRQDPDIIMIGEIRDQETAKIATQAALTGHMVLSTLHTNDAPSAVTRLINIGVEPYLVAAALKGVLAQRLVRRLCSTCKEPGPVPEKALRAFELAGWDKPPVTEVQHPVGCAKCRNTGYSGRAGVHELMTFSEDMLESIVRGGSLQDLRKSMTGDDYTTLLFDGLEKIIEGTTTIDEIMTATTIT